MYELNDSQTRHDEDVNSTSNSNVNRDPTLEISIRYESMCARGQSSETSNL